MVTTSDLDFGTDGVLNVNIDQSTNFTVHCTNGTPYSVGLSTGNGIGATTASRKLSNLTSDTVTYSLYRNSARTLVWGTTIGTDTVSGIGSGNAQILTVHGRVPSQPTPSSGAYSDSITITVTY